MILISVTLYASEASDPVYYIWAYSGLNLREAPGTDQKIIEKLTFGDSLMIQNETDVSYHIIGIKNIDTTQRYNTRYERKAPFILYGKWVKVSTYSGKVGYVINQYLLQFPPYETKGLKLKEIKSDTVVIDENGWPKTYLHKIYNDNINSYNYLNEKYYEETFIFPDLSIQEAFIILNCDRSLLNTAVVIQNWKDTLSFSNGGMCDFKIDQFDGYVQVIWSCSC